VVLKRLDSPTGTVEVEATQRVDMIYAITHYINKKKKVKEIKAITCKGNVMKYFYRVLCSLKD